MPLTVTKKIILSALLAIYALSLALVLDNMADRDLLRNAVMVALPTAICAAAAYYVVRLRVQELAFVLVPLVVFALVLEGALSVYLMLRPDQVPALLWGHGDDLAESFAYRPHHYTLFTLKEGYRNRQGTVHNRQGFRNLEDLPEVKPAGEFRIFFIGGSTTYTVGIKDNRHIFSERLEEALNHEAGTRRTPVRFRVVNAGLGAATSAENLARLIFLIHPYEPDLVIIQHGMNDVLPRLRGRIQSDYANYRRMWCGSGRQYDFFLKQWVYEGIVTRSRLLTLLSVRLGLLEPNTIRGVINNNALEERDENLDVNGPEFFRRNTELMVLAARHAGADVILASCPYNERVGEARMRAMPEHHALLREVARRMQVPYFDLYGAFNRDPEHLPDGLHVSQKGSDLKAALYFDYLVRDYGVFARCGRDDAVSASPSRTASAP